MLHFLFLSLLAIALAPVFLKIASKRHSALAFMDAFILFAVVGLVVLHILPESLIHAGIKAAFAALLGLLLPFLMNHLLKPKGHSHCEVHGSILTIAWIGLAAHAVLDGMALSEANHLQMHEEGGASLAYAVILHRLPEGMGLWRVLQPRYGNFFGAVGLAGMMLATSLGFFSGSTLAEHMSEGPLMTFQAFMGGTLLHLIFHRHLVPHIGHAAPESKTMKRVFFAIGALAGIGIAVVLSLTSWHHHLHSH
jgi:hypothetical protein